MLTEGMILEARKTRYDFHAYVLCSSFIHIKTFLSGTYLSWVGAFRACKIIGFAKA